MNRIERIKMQRMQRRIRLVVEERRVAFAARAADEPAVDAEATMEIPPPEAVLLPPRAIGRVTVHRR